MTSVLLTQEKKDGQIKEVETMVTIKCNKPKTCGKCTFVVYYENLHRGIPDCCCGLQYLLNRKDREVDPKNMDSQCPLKEVDEFKKY